MQNLYFCEMQFTCPKCGSPVLVRSELSILYTCAHCRSTLIRTEQGPETIGQVSGIVEDLSPFMPGTGGRWQDKRFTLLGRIRLQYGAGYWSEWWAWFDDGSTAWLAEAQGLYLMMRELPAEIPAKQLSALKPGDSLAINGRSWRIIDCKEVTYVGCEGELPWRFVAGEKGLSYDLVHGREVATLYFNGTDWTWFEGEYADFDSFQFDNLREIHGWQMD